MTTKLDRLMVQGRPQDTGSLYKIANIMPALDALGGVRKMRCRDPYRGTPGWATYVALARAGVKFCFTASIRPPATIVADMAALLDVVPNCIWAIELPNEPDLNPVTYLGQTDVRLGSRTGNAPALMKFCTDLRAAIALEPRLNALPVIGFTGGMVAEQKAVATMINSHMYPRSPGLDFTNWLANLVLGQQTQGAITELGRTTGGDDKNVTAKPVTTDQQATLLAADLALAFAQPSVHTVSIYELFCWSGGGEQQNFGLFNCDLSPRPAVAAIRAVATS